MELSVQLWTASVSGLDIDSIVKWMCDMIKLLSAVTLCAPNQNVYCNDFAVLQL